MSVILLNPSRLVQIILHNTVVARDASSREMMMNGDEDGDIWIGVLFAYSVQKIK
jgi:hypothetical protein